MNPPELTDLTFQLLHPGPLFGAQTRASSDVALSLAHPVPQRLRRAPDLLGHRPNRRPLRVVLMLVIEHQSHRSLPDLW